MFAVILIPDFFLQSVLRFEPVLAAAPVALLTDSSAKTAAVWQMTSAAQRAGVELGMASTQAQARCPKITFRIHSIAQEQSAQQILLECAYSFAAYIESTGPGICTMDLRGLSALNSNGDDALLAKACEFWARQIVQRLAPFHLRPQIGIAATPALALQAAHCADPFLHITNPPEFWSKLPIQSISPSPEIFDVLRRWGIFTVGEFLALGKDKISERLGVEGVQLFEHASADVTRPLTLTAPAQVYEESFEYDREIETLEPLLFMLRRFLEQLSRRVELAGLVIEELTLTLQLTSAQQYQRPFRIPAPTRDVEVLFRILYNHLETVRTDAPIRALSLRASPCLADNQQFELFQSAVRDPNRFFETIGRLSALLGADRVGTPVIQPTHRPDDVRMQPVSLQAERTLKTRSPRKNSARGLPLRRFRPPLTITVQMRKDQPGSFNSAKISGAVLNARGPWRSSGNWWEKSWQREEWDVQTQQGLYRLFREGENWFIEGVYD